MIYVAADIHGYIRLDLLKENMKNILLSPEDYLLIAGDVGIVWEENFHKDVYDFYQNLPCKTLFVDGNHENFNLLNAYPITKWNGGNTHKITDKIYHLMRGEVFSIDNKKIFVFGGGFSAKQLTNSSPVTIWKEELPNNIEYENARKNLEIHNWSFDYIITHSAPVSLVKRLGFEPYKNTLELLEFLEEVYNKAQYNKWYFGHYHLDMQIENNYCVFKTIKEIC